MSFICTGCQPRRDSYMVKHRSKARHECLGNGCGCGSCYPTPPVSDEKYNTWMATLGAFYIENSKTLGKMLIERKLKPKPED